MLKIIFNISVIYVIDPIILKNRKCIGSLQQHRIQQRPPRPSSFRKKPLIQELNSKGSISQLDKHVKPEYKLYVQPEDNPKQLIIDIWLPEVVILNWQKKKKKMYV